jgi:hypothetical protein
MIAARKQHYHLTTRILRLLFLRIGPACALGSRPPLSGGFSKADISTIYTKSSVSISRSIVQTLYSMLARSTTVVSIDG